MISFFFLLLASGRVMRLDADADARITEKLSPRSGAVDMQEFDFQWAVGGATRQRGSTGHARPAPLGADRKDPAQRADAKAPTPAQQVGKKAPAPKQKADKKAPMPTPKDATKNSAAIRERHFQTKGRQGWQPQQQVFFPW